MKKYLVLLSFIALGFTSCQDARDIDPIDSISEDQAFENVDDLELGINGMYASYNPLNIESISSRVTDDVKIGADSGGQGVPDINQILDPGSASTNAIWAGHYGVINIANRIIAAAANITPSSPQEAERYNKVLGQCYAMRAFCHFELTMMYSTSFSASELAVPYIDFVVVFEEPARNTVGEVFDRIEGDFAQAATLLSGETDNAFITNDLITAVRAKIALFTGNYPTAISLADQLIAKYPLADREQYVAMFNDTDDREVIWKLIRTQNDGRPGGLYYFTGTGGAFIEMSNSMFDALDPNDIRFEVLLDTDLSNPANNFHLINKYPGVPGFPFLNDIKHYRVAEMHLVKAEAQARNNQLAAAASSIKVLRDVRFGAATALPSYADLRAAIIDILAERRVELGYEGHRYIDLRRTRDITGNGIVRDPRDCGGATPCEMAPNDRRFTMPIPQAEINGNANMVQNPGYGN